MAYKLSNRRNQTIKIKPDTVDLGKLATVFILFGLLGLLTAFFYSLNDKDIISTKYQQVTNSASPVFGPISVRKYNEVYKITLYADIPLQSWAFIEGEVLDSQKQYLFSFGKELWHEEGHDSDGRWEEQDSDYTMHVTFPKPGIYYIQIKSESNAPANRMALSVSKQQGSTVPHLTFGVITILIALPVYIAFSFVFAFFFL